MSSSVTYNTTPRWLSIVLGIASIIFGWLFLTNPGTTLLAIAILLGLYFLVIGIVSIIGIFTGAPGSKLWKLIGGILAIIAGVLLLMNPVIGSVATGVTFNFLVAFFAILTGIALLIDGFQGGGCLAIILGILGIVLGILVLFNPLSGVMALPIVMGIVAIAGGIMAILGAIFRPSPPPPPPAPVRTVSAPPVTAPKPDVAKVATGVAAAGAAAAAATKAVAADTAQAVDTTAAKAAATVAVGADVVSDETAQATRMGVEDLTLLRLGLSEDVIEGLPDDVTAKLADAGVHKPADLLQLAATPAGRAQLTSATGIPDSAILRWANQLDLRRVKGVGEASHPLEARRRHCAGLAQRNPANLLNRMIAVNTERAWSNGCQPSPVESWVNQAKELRILTYQYPVPRVTQPRAILGLFHDCQQASPEIRREQHGTQTLHRPAGASHRGSAGAVAARNLSPRVLGSRTVRVGASRPDSTDLPGQRPPHRRWPALSPAIDSRGGVGRHHTDGGRRDRGLLSHTR
jgi:uncharacterized membrane protein HdeD (DUF308 family)